MAVQVMAMILSEMTLVEEGVYQEMAMTRSEKALEVGVEEAQEMAQRYQDAGAEEQEKLVVTVLMSVVVEEVV